MLLRAVLPSRTAHSRVAVQVDNFFSHPDRNTGEYGIPLAWLTMIEVVLVVFCDLASGPPPPRRRALPAPYPSSQVIVELAHLVTNAMDRKLLKMHWGAASEQMQAVVLGLVFLTLAMSQQPKMVTNMKGVGYFTGMMWESGFPEGGSQYHLDGRRGEFQYMDLSEVGVDGARLRCPPRGAAAPSHVARVGRPQHRVQGLGLGLGRPRHHPLLEPLKASMRPGRLRTASATSSRVR